LKAEKQRADQEAGLKPKPASKTRTTTDEEAKDAATGFQGWLSRNKPIAAFAVVAFVAVCVQASGAYDVKAAVMTLLSPILTPIWKVRLHCRSSTTTVCNAQDKRKYWCCGLASDCLCCCMDVTGWRKQAQ